MSTIKRAQAVLAGIHAIVLILVAPAWADEADEHVMGDPNAALTIIEYASMSCPHCANFHAKGLPWLKENYIDTGKVRLVFRDFPHNERGLLGAVVAHCAGSDRYFAFVDTIFKNQQQWAFGDDPVGALAKLAKARGMGRETFDACLKNEQLQEKILKSRLDAHETYKVESIPSFVIDGQLFRGMPSEQELDKMVAAASE